MSFSALPVVLAKAILLELRDSPSTPSETSPGAWRRDVASCSLVAHSWRGLSQELLFEKLEVTLRNNFDVVYDADGGRGRILEDFLLLITGSPHLVPYIRELSIAPRAMSKDEQLDLLFKVTFITIPGPKLDLEFSVLASVVAQLPELQSIRLHYVDLEFSNFDYEGDTAELPLAPNVEHLHLSASDEASGMTPDNLFMFLSWFPRLEELSLWGTNYELPLEIDTEPLEHLAPLRCLRHISMLDGLSNQALQVLRVAADRGCLPSLEMLDVDVDTSEDVLTLQALLDRLGGQLSRLGVHYNQFAAGKIIYDPSNPTLNFAPCTRLVHLSFRCFTDRGEPLTPLWDHFVRALAPPARFPVLRTLTFEFTFDAAKEDPQHCNAPIDETHAQRLVDVLLALRTLERVEFRPPTTSWAIPYRAVEREHLRARLAELDRTGILVLS